MEKPQDKVKEPFSAYGRYSYADYLTWQLEDMVELIRGKVFRQAAAAPRRIHQGLTVALVTRIHGFLKGGSCRVYTAPFDVRLPVSSRKHADIDTVVQPDLCVVCDPDKLDELGCVGAPDLIVEILSPGNNKKELQLKYEVYEATGVKEYWVIHPDERTLLIYTLEAGKYRPSRLFTLGDEVESQVLSGFVLDLEEVFGEL
ncbi:Putative restriction endonuclease [Cyclobacterium xiamenense]|uniref:Putative restriction endonuclease n=1 Tax=Cyclobacterium xiamenense TaxID=1297121 RepID=A0A1H6W3L7_9BACT|nr:Uma2 family endonuclease [Cyclobacterium xiamenense]SEJ11503.1 Putative restriction endonuclease [Cyclobacterium xiamenense]